MKSIVLQYSKLSDDFREGVDFCLENEHPIFTRVPFKGKIAEGFVYMNDGTRYLIILDNEVLIDYVMENRHDLLLDSLENVYQGEDEMDFEDYDD